MCPIHNDFKHITDRNERFSVPPQASVNHVSQSVVNHVDESSTSDIRLTDLFKLFRKGLWQTRLIDREHNLGGETSL